MSHTPLQHFGGNTLNRQSVRRRIENYQDLLAERRTRARILVLDNLKFMVSEDTRVVWVRLSDLEPEAPESVIDGTQDAQNIPTKPDGQPSVSSSRAVYLGHDDTTHTPYWTINITGLPSTLLQRLTTSLYKGSQFVPMRPNAMMVPAFDAGLLAQAVSMVDWNARNKHCPACGSITISTEAGYKRTCISSTCESHRSTNNYTYPRTDPVVIVAVVSSDGTKVLLGRQRGWKPSLYSCIAGFVEPGETLESACAREVQEETGIQLDRVQYLTSQPWPFPSSIMIGCVGIAKRNGENIVLGDDELEDAKWFRRDDVAQALSSSSQTHHLSVPPKSAIANALMQAWVNGDAGLTHHL